MNYNTATETEKSTALEALETWNYEFCYTFYGPYDTADIWTLMKTAGDATAAADAIHNDCDIIDHIVEDYHAGIVSAESIKEITGELLTYGRGSHHEYSDGQKLIELLLTIKAFDQVVLAGTEINHLTEYVEDAYVSSRNSFRFDEFPEEVYKEIEEYYGELYGYPEDIDREEIARRVFSENFNPLEPAEDCNENEDSLNCIHCAQVKALEAVEAAGL